MYATLQPGEGVRSIAFYILRSTAEGKGETWKKIGERRTRGMSAAGVHNEGLTAIFFASKESVMGTSTVGIVVVPPAPDLDCER